MPLKIEQSTLQFNPAYIAEFQVCRYHIKEIASGKVDKAGVEEVHNVSVLHDTFERWISMYDPNERSDYTDCFKPPQR